MIRTSITLSTENQRFWDFILPRGEKGIVLNSLLDQVRGELKNPDGSYNLVRLQNFLVNIRMKKVKFV